MYVYIHLRREARDGVELLEAVERIAEGRRPPEIPYAIVQYGIV